MMPDAEGTKRLPSGLIGLTFVKWVLATAQRWVSAFLPILAAGFGLSTGSMTSIMGIGQLGGLTTIVTGRRINPGNERTFVVAGVALVSVSCLAALAGTPLAFGISFVLLVIGHAHFTVAAHAWIGDRVPYAVRGRAIGVFETSWALALLIGAPILAALIATFSWRAGYVALVAATIPAAVLGFVAVGHPDPAHRAAKAASGQLGRQVWPPILGSAFAVLAGIGFFTIAGAWLADVHGVKVGGLGAVAAAAGLVELVGSTTVATATDRIGLHRAILGGLTVVLVGLVTIVVGGDIFAVAIVGLLAVLGGFEFAFVSSLALVTEASVDARGTAIGISNAVGTVGRGAGVAIAGTTYERFGIVGPAVVAGTSIVISMGWILISRRDHIAAAVSGAPG